MFFTVLAVLGTGLSAYSSIQQGKIKQKEYDIQARLAALKTRSTVVNSKEKGVKVLKDLNRNLATVFAYKAIGGSDPSSGSAVTLGLTAMRAGATDFNLTAIQSRLDNELGLIEYKNLKIAGENAKIGGYNKAMSQVMMATASYGMQGGFDNIFAPKHTGNTKFVASDWGVSGRSSRVRK